MLNKILICKTSAGEGGHRLLIKTPSIGRVTLTVLDGQVLQPGQLIGELQRLDQRFALHLADDAAGVIASRASPDRVMLCGFGEMILTLEENIQTGSSKLVDEKKKHLGTNSIDAPMDGMFYLSASPKDPPYVKIGDVITPGQTIGLIEVMKCFYPLKYQGQQRVTLVDIRVNSASPVSAGTKLMTVENT